MIIRENIVEVEEVSKEFMLHTNEINRTPEDVIFFDLEHYVYKKPKCIGVFGACIYNNKDKKIYVTQYMIENKNEVVDLLILAKKYFINMKEAGKKAIVTFSGNNDFTVINYLFKKYNIEYDFSIEYESIDIQKEYERERKTSIGLKNLEKLFDIHREGDLISGSNLAKTFHKVLKDREYIIRMPKEKIETILLYNEQDVTNLCVIFKKWNQYIINIEKENEEYNEKENEEYNEKDTEKEKEEYTEKEEYNEDIEIIDETKKIDMIEESEIKLEVNNVI
ncbi:ribonuclease H-like domain-containing protein [Clostridium gasigenes]|uniref:Ribonuclease H-like domain-containing protein n=1 Tax=Clostridium gasigenes TaxID=94869 RepID=A0A7X0VSM0_9CLOT|nr:ribonuclease H-like domain-containing protein [Clostridium gasigenes]MBB6714736.1 ribonuclease H-like domain-containing protein [Clostridium gasigenes]